MTQHTLNWHNLQANSAASLALYTGDSLTDIREVILPGTKYPTTFCVFNGAKMRQSEAKSRMIDSLLKSKASAVRERAEDMLHDRQSSERESHRRRYP